MKISHLKLLWSFGQGFIGEGDLTPEEQAAKDAADAAEAARLAEEEKNRKKSYTQDELNAIIKAERKTAEDKIRKQIELNENLQKSKNLTDVERTQLAKHNEQLKNELLSKEELAANERRKLAEQHQTEVKTLSSERDKWREQYNTAEITRGISDAGQKFKAVSNEQLAAIVRPWTSMAEEVDANGQGTGVYAPKVKYPTKDKDGKPIVLELSIGDTVKLMQETPERFGNLFESGLKAGLGMDGGTGRRTAQDIRTMSPEAYQKARRAEEAASGRK
jgi:DNA-binding protein H-NS